MKPHISVVSLGPGDPDLLNLKTLRLLKSGHKVILRTGRHPVASFLKEEEIAFSTLDELYETAEDFQVLAAQSAEFLWEQAAAGPVVYGVPDFFSDASLRALADCRPEGAVLEIIPGVSYTDASLAKTLFLLSSADLRTVSAMELAVPKAYDPNVPLLICEIDQEILAGQVKVCLSEYLDDEQTILLLRPDQSPKPIPLFELDRQPRYDHLTSVLVPASSFRDRQRFIFADLMQIMDTLRAPDGCPWDGKQTHESLRPYLIEEAWETVGAIDENDPDHLAEELGDLLFQIVFHASIGRSFDEFTILDVISCICRKMIRRHPHVFAHAVYQPSEASGKWDEIKRAEAGGKSVIESLSDVSPALPALQYAEKIIKKIKQLPVPARTEEMILRDLQAASASLSSTEMDNIPKVFGAILYHCAEWAQLHGLDGEILLHEFVSDVIRTCQQKEKASP